MKLKHLHPIVMSSCFVQCKVTPLEFMIKVIRPSFMLGLEALSLSLSRLAPWQHYTVSKSLQNGSKKLSRAYSSLLQVYLIRALFSIENLIQLSLSIYLSIYTQHYFFKCLKLRVIGKGYIHLTTMTSKFVEFFPNFF